MKTSSLSALVPSLSRSSTFPPFVFPNTLFRPNLGLDLPAVT